MKKTAILLVILLTVIPFGAMATEYSITDYSMDVVIATDGSAGVTENLSYYFDGEYNGILSSIDVGKTGGMENLRLYVDGDTPLQKVDEMEKEPFTYTVEREGDMVNVVAYAPGEEGARDFRYEYRLLGVAKRYRDAAQLNYRFIGLNNDAALEDALIRVTFPGAPEHYFAHGAMSDEDIVRESDTVLVLGPRMVYPGEYAELNALFPPESLSGVEPIDEDVVESTLELERTLLIEKEAREAAEAEAAAEWQQRGRILLIGLYAALFIGMALLLRGQIASYGLKRDIAPTSDLAELEGLDAAVAQKLVQNKVDESGLSATLLELVQKGALSMASQPHPLTGEKAAKFIVQNRSAALSAQQRALFDWLFGGRDFLWIDDLNAGEDETQAQAFVDGFTRWSNLVTEAVKKDGYISKTRVALGVGITLTLVMGPVLSFFAFEMNYGALGIAGLILTALLLIGFFRVRRLTDAGEKKFAAVRGFCEVYGEHISGIPAETVKYLPIVVALGYVEPLAKYLDLHPDGYSDDNGMMPIWWYAGWYHDIGHFRHSLKEVRNHNSSVVAKHDSSGSSGGGFTGSSGGGGGGGGHGAW